MNQNPTQLGGEVLKLSPTSEPQDLRDLVLKWLSVYELVFPNYGEPRTEAAVLVYLELLEDLTEAELAHGLEQAALRCKQFPTIAHIRQFAEEALPSHPADAAVTFEQIGALWRMIRAKYPNQTNLARAEKRFFRVLSTAPDALEVGRKMLAGAKALADVPFSQRRYKVPSLFEFVDERWREDWTEATRTPMAWE